MKPRFKLHLRWVLWSILELWIRPNEGAGWGLQTLFSSSRKYNRKSLDGKLRGLTPPAARGR